MYAIEKMHVLRITKAVATEAMEGNDQWQWLGVVMSSGHPQLRVSALIANRHISVIISVICRSKTVIGARKMFF